MATQPKEPQQKKPRILQEQVSEEKDVAGSIDDLVVAMKDCFDKKRFYCSDMMDSSAAHFKFRMLVNYLKQHKDDSSKLSNFVPEQQVLQGQPFGADWH